MIRSPAPAVYKKAAAQQIQFRCGVGIAPYRQRPVEIDTKRVGGRALDGALDQVRAAARQQHEVARLQRKRLAIGQLHAGAAAEHQMKRRLADGCRRVIQREVAGQQAAQVQAAAHASQIDHFAEGIHETFALDIESIEYSSPTSPAQHWSPRSAPC
jgi:hypothetical protein